MTSRAFRVSTVMLALICALAIALAIDARATARRGDTRAAQWQAEAAGWEGLARDNLAARQAVARRYNQLVLRYNRTTRSLARAARKAAPPPEPVQAVPAAQAPAPVPVPVQAPAPRPTSRTS